ncbi:MAG: PD-(D/E)XK nuclease family protein [Deltaproteobacteria bacterium]|nr:PD-(D/E)XK nuclease family protein [Deltaproteobacteria bacterium]
MRVVFGEAFDQGAWPGPLADRDACYDDAWVGPLGLLGLLETALGLTGPREASEAERAASIVPALRALDGPWSRSLEGDADHLAVARAVLRTRDALVLSGVPPLLDADVPLGPRLRAFLQVTREVRAGLPERLAAVASAASRRRVDVARIELVDDAPWPLLGRALEALAASGVEIAQRAVQPAHASGDLARAQAAPFVPAGDGTLQLVRGDCVEETAAAVAAHAAGLLRHDGAAAIVVIAPDDALDAGLARLGLPTTGARGDAADDALAQVIPLVLALAWPERDPERAFELLSLATSPIRRSVGSRLARALAEQPGVGSPRWREALSGALEALPADERAAAARRIDEVFAAPVLADTMPVAVFEERLALVRRWLFGRAARKTEPAALAALAQLEHAARIARALGSNPLSRLDVTRVLAEAAAASRAPGPRPALAGLRVVGDAAAVVGPAAHVVWWGFAAASERPLALPSLSAAERAGMATLGAVLESPASLAERRARAYARPLLCASNTLLLACPRRDARGDEQHPHPLWDEVVARARGDEVVASLVTRQSQHERHLEHRPFRDRQLPLPRARWRVAAGSVPVTMGESPTSREALLGCAFAATLRRAGLSERAHALPDDRRLFGELAHRVIGEVLATQRSAVTTEVRRDAPVDGDSAVERARAAFDRAVPEQAAVLLRPEEKSRRLHVREAIARAAGRLVEVLADRGLRVRDVERELVVEKDGRAVRGRPDLVVGDPLVVVDIKSGRDAEHRRALEAGRAVQLIAYAALVRATEQRWPELAYFMVRSGRLLTTSVALGGEQAFDPPLTVEQAYRRLKHAVQQAERALADGVVTAPGVGAAEASASDVVEGPLHVPPPCAVCGLGALCGRLLPGGKERS